MKPQGFGHVSQTHGKQCLGTTAEESGLGVYDGLGTPQKSTFPLGHRLPNTFSLLKFVL